MAAGDRGRHSGVLECGYSATAMRVVAASVGVAVPTVELLFGTKPRLLKAAIDVTIAGDDEPVGVLDRSCTADATGRRRRSRVPLDRHGRHRAKAGALMV